MGRFAKTFESLLNVGSSVVSIVTNWNVVVGLLGAAAIAYQAWIEDYGVLAIALTALGAFAAIIWSWNGLVWLRRQRRPSKAMLDFDYSYSLALEQVVPALDLENERNTLEFRLVVKNTSQRPIRMQPEKIEFRVEDRFVEAIPRGSIIAANMSITIIPNRGFSKDAWLTFKDRTHGSIVFSILYGHPDYPFSRRAIKYLDIDLFKTDEGKGVIINWLISHEADQEVIPA